MGLPRALILASTSRATTTHYGVVRLDLQLITSGDQNTSEHGTTTLTFDPIVWSCKLHFSPCPVRAASFHSPLLVHFLFLTYQSPHRAVGLSLAFRSWIHISVLQEWSKCRRTRNTKSSYSSHNCSVHVSFKALPSLLLTYWSL